MMKICYCRNLTPCVVTIICIPEGFCSIPTSVDGVTYLKQAVFISTAVRT